MSLALLALLGCGPRPAPPAVPPPAVLAQPEPEPVRDVLYFVFVDRFADGSPDPEGTVDRSDPQAWHGGDLRGVIDHLDYLDQLGIGGIWLSPITKARTDKIDDWGAFHGYWVEDLGAIEPRMGTLEDAAALSQALHARGTSLWLDMVYNHVGYDTPLTVDHPDWFHHNGDVVDWEDPVQVVTHDVHGLPDLAQENEAVYAHLLADSQFWIDAVHPDGFRVDAVRHLPEGFLARLGDDLRAHSGGEFALLGEVFEGHAAKLAARQRADKLDRVFDFPLHYAMKDVFCHGAHTGRIASVLSQDRAYPDPRALVTFLDNHDVSRIRSECGGDRDKVAQALAFLLASRGTPCLTWGTEAGFEGAHEPANRADMVFHGPGSDPAMYTTVRQLLDLRATWPSLRDGVTRIDRADPDVLVVRRLTEGEQAWIVVNHGDTPIPVPEGATEGQLVSGAGTLVAARGEVPPGAVGLLRQRGELTDHEPAPVRLEIQVSAPLEEGDALVLVGTGEALGDWDPAHGVPARDGVIALEVPEGDVLACKLVVQRADGSVQWEDRADRYLRVEARSSTAFAWNED